MLDGHAREVADEKTKDVHQNEEREKYGNRTRAGRPNKSSPPDNVVRLQTVMAVFESTRYLSLVPALVPRHGSQS